MASKKAAKAKPAVKISKAAPKKGKKTSKPAVIPVQSREHEPLPIRQVDSARTNAEQFDSVDSQEPAKPETANAAGDADVGMGPTEHPALTAFETTDDAAITDTVIASAELSAPAVFETTGASIAEPKMETSGPEVSKTADAAAEPKKLSAIDAAVKVLAEAAQPMTCLEMIETMTAKGYWTSPGGKTPASTLFAAILREIKVKQGAARFQKTERGKFAIRA